MAGALNQTLSCDGHTYVTTYGDVIRCVVILVIMVLIIVGNVCCLVVFNNVKSRKHFMTRVRYTMTSLCFTDLCIGVLMCPSTVYPALKHCWPFGETFCKFEALLISALFHESTLNMVLIAIDRYFIIHHRGYPIIMTSRKFLIIILGTWIGVFSTYAIVIFVGEQFYFDEVGVNCEPFYQNPNVTLSVLSIFYFVPAIIFVFCYGSIYITATRRKILTNKNAEKPCQKRLNANIRTSKYLAAITLGFFCAVSPWTLATLIIVAAKIRLPDIVDFLVTWLALSNSFMNCLIYGVMNRKFRLAAMRFACGRWVKSVRDNLVSKTDAENEYVSDENVASANSAGNMQQLAIDVTCDISASPIATPVILMKSLSHRDRGKEEETNSIYLVTHM